MRNECWESQARVMPVVFPWASVKFSSLSR
jgi:hypothetical protein